jgi:hypothetical protein
MAHAPMGAQRFAKVVPLVDGRLADVVSRIARALGSPLFAG